MGSPWPPLLLPPTTMCPSLLPVINPLLLLLLLLILWTSKSRRRNDSRGHVLKGFECFGSPNGHSFTIENRRMMNASAVATALRPFYFAVHPDLFGRFPEYRAINEDSLKLLSAHLESLNTNRMVLTATPRTLPFYVRYSADKDKKSTSNTNSRLIRVPIERTVDTKRVIKGILSSCDLSTEFVDKIESKTPPPPSSNDGPRPFGSNFYQETPPPGVFDEEVIYRDIRRAQEERTLSGWLKEHLDLAQERQESLVGLREEIQKLRSELMEKLKLLDLRYECGWNIEHFRGCMKSLEYMANLHAHDMRFLEGRVLVFAPFTGISLDGHVMLFTGDVKHNWIDFLRKIPRHDEYLKKIPAYEYALSQVLRNIKIKRRKFMPKTQAEYYASHLRKVTTALLDYQSRNKYPEEWPETLEDFELVVESESGPMMISPTGQIIVPATCPGSILVDFITTNLKVARDRAKTYKETKHVERELHKLVTQKYSLMSLNKDDAISPANMIECLEKLLLLDDGIRIGKDQNLMIDHYYSVLSDGTICIPWNWTL